MTNGIMPCYSRRRRARSRSIPKGIQCRVFGSSLRSIPISRCSDEPLPVVGQDWYCNLQSGRGRQSGVAVIRRCVFVGQLTRPRATSHIHMARKERFLEREASIPAICTEISSSEETGDKCSSGGYSYHKARRGSRNGRIRSGARHIGIETQTRRSPVPYQHTRKHELPGTSTCPFFVQRTRPVWSLKCLSSRHRQSGLRPKDTGNYAGTSF